MITRSWWQMFPKPGRGWTLMAYKRGEKYVLRYFYPAQPEAKG
ncbi:MAG: hypothetical protein R3212_05645 [Xanthomonadales bacterium]|nr:hypothetical protein [Xanthomonadales bacterium]